MEYWFMECKRERKCQKSGRIELMVFVKGNDNYVPFESGTSRLKYCLEIVSRLEDGINATHFKNFRSDITNARVQ